MDFNRSTCTTAYPLAKKNIPLVMVRGSGHTAMTYETTPEDAMDQYLAQPVPNAETTLEGGGRNTVNALVALLDMIGPAVVKVHSQSGVYGLDVARHMMVMDKDSLRVAEAIRKWIGENAGR